MTFTVSTSAATDKVKPDTEIQTSVSDPSNPVHIEIQNCNLISQLYTSFVHL